MSEKDTSSNMKFYVYLLVNSLDNKVFYVGKGKEYRAFYHTTIAKRGGQYHVHRKIRKILEGGGEVLIKKVFETNDELFVLAEEQRLIAEYGRVSLTNMTDGGEGSSGYKHTEEVKDRLRQMRLGKKLTPEAITKREATRKARNIPAWNKGKRTPEDVRRKISRSLIGNQHTKGKRQTEETRQKISLALMGHLVSEKSRETFIRMARRPKSEQHRKRLSEACKGRQLSEETKAKISATLMGHRHSDETKRKIGLGNEGKEYSRETRMRIALARSKETRCIETGQIFQSAKFASASVGRSENSVGEAIRRGGKCAGFTWEYIVHE